jgi:acetyltransferase-like isoleucine patch superfamily enzyme
MKPARLYISSLIFRGMPETRFFTWKAALLRWAGAEIGNNVNICSSVTVLGIGSLEIGDDTWVGHEVLISSSSSVRIGSCVDIAPRVFIGTGTHQLDAKGTHSAGAGINKDIVIGDGVWLGAGSIVLPGIAIGRKAVVAAGAVVTHDVTENVIVAGIPAKVIKSLTGETQT